MCGSLRLGISMRTLVVFDASNEEHRKDFMLFKKTKSLGYTKYRYVPPVKGSVLDLMQEELLKYYTRLEFNESR